MPVPEQRLYRPDRLNRWFAVSSILMTASILWMVYIDYKRPWHAYQDDYFVTRAALSHLEVLNYSRQEYEQKITEAEQRLKDARELDAATNAAKRAKLNADLTEADLKFRQADAPYGRLVQVLQVSRDTLERLLGAHGADHAETREAQRVVDEQFEESERLRKETEHWSEVRRQVAAELKSLDAKITAADRDVRDLKKPLEDAEEKDRQFRGVLTDQGLLAGLPIVKTIINWPLLDFAAPKNTASRRQVNQLVLPDVRQRLNYLESYTTDRCTTCHIAIDDPAFSRTSLAKDIEQALPAMNEGLQRLNYPPMDLPAPPAMDGGVTLKPGEVTEYWDDLNPDQQDGYFQTLVALTNRYLKLSGRKTIGLDEPVIAHPDLDLYVSTDSPHPMNKMGCTVCHEGNPQETDFVFAAHSPPDHETEARWRDAYYQTVLGVPNITFETMAHFWDRPMHWPQYTEAGCAKCHTEIADIGRFRGDRKGERINLGRHLFQNLGCVNCHVVNALAGSRRVGPDLSHVAAKLKPDFVEPWVYFPQKFRPTTRMPHFFAQENNRAESGTPMDPAPVTRTETEVAAMTKYLFAISKPWEPLKPPAGVKGDAARGRELFSQVGCLACHSNLAEYGEGWITRDMMARESLDEEKAKFRYKGMTHEERALYALEHFNSETDTFLRPEVATFENGGKEPPPTVSRFAPELSAIGSKVTKEWLYSWLVNPHHFAPETKMPSLRLSPEEASDIAEYLSTLKHEKFEATQFAMDGSRQKMLDDLLFGLLTAQRSERHSRAILRDEGGELGQLVLAMVEPVLGKDAAYERVQPLSLMEKKQLYLGNKMIGHYGCYACHTIPGFEETTPPGTDLSGWAEKPVSQLDFAFFGHAFHDMRHEKEEVFGHVYPTDAVELNKWSPGENPEEQITETHAAFAKHKMLNPRIWDRKKIKSPYDKLKMPNFYLDAEEVEALTTYLLSRVPPRVNQSLQIDYDSGVDGPIARGRSLTRELNCIACHQVEDNVPTIQQYFRRPIGGKLVLDVINAPPSLRGEGAKLQHQWFHHFLLNVEPLRPWLQVRMPSFKLTVEQATTLVQYFAALSQDDSEQLGKATAVVDEFIKAHVGKPGEWVRDESMQRQREVVKQFAVERSLVRKQEVDPLRSAADALQAGFEKALGRVRFIQKLYDVAYPFVEPPRPLSADDRYAQGTAFFNDMGCLKCHVLGQMLPGPAKDTDDFPQMYRLDGVRGAGASAVALINGRPYAVGAEIDDHKLLSAENIYYESGDVETKAIIEGPKRGGGTEKILLQAPSAPNLSLTHRRLRRDWVVQWMLEPSWIQPGTKMPQNFVGGKSPFEGDSHYPGTSEDHLHLLVDFLFDAGFRNARAPLPKLIAAEPKAFDEEPEEFNEDE